MQMAAVAAGGEVRKNPHGREMGFARKLRLTAEGRVHPMYEGKPDVFDGFISHRPVPRTLAQDHQSIESAAIASMTRRLSRR